MSFTLTDDDYNELDSIKGQLGFVTSLLGHRTTPLEINSSDFSEFLIQLHSTASKLIATCDARKEAARQRQAVNFIDWMHIVQALSGRVTLRRRRLKEITTKLKGSIDAQPEMEFVYDAWLDAMALAKLQT